MSTAHIDINKLHLAMNEMVKNWIYDPNVMLIDYGWPESEGKLNQEKLEIRVHVKEKYKLGAELESSIGEGKTRARIPRKIGDFDVDVPVGNYKLNQWWWWRPSTARSLYADPMKGGVSISDVNRYIYATLGGLVRHRKTGKDMLLSNWHVLVGSWSAQRGQAIIQPGRGDGGSEDDIVATLADDAMSSGLDAAVAELTGRRKLVNDQIGLGPVTGVGWAQLGMKIVKSGRRTGITYGLVTAIDGTLKIDYEGVERFIKHVFTIEPQIDGREVSAGGDSGSLWCQEGTMKAVGLHFAGGNEPERALAMDLQSVLDALDINLVY